MVAVPSFCATFGTNGADITRPTVAGSVASPASKGVIAIPDGSWKNRLTANIKPVDRAGADQDPDRGADQHAIAHQFEVDERGG